VRGDHFFLLIGATRPEEAAQAVLAFSRNDVDVKVRDALADDIVDGDKAAFRLHAVLNSARKLLGIQEKGTDEVSRKVEQRWIVRFGNEQDVAGKKGTNVEESQGDFVFENNFGLHFARDDFAEQAGFASGRVGPLWFGVRARFFHWIRLILPSGLRIENSQRGKMRG